MQVNTITDTKYQKHPTTFLNGENYLDIEGYQKEAKHNDKDFSMLDINTNVLKKYSNITPKTWNK